MLTRRLFRTPSSAIAAAGLAARPAMARGREIQQVYPDGDTNNPDGWNNAPTPAFKPANPDMTLNVTIAQPALAAMQAKTVTHRGSPPPMSSLPRPKNRCKRAGRS